MEFSSNATQAITANQTHQKNTTPQPIRLVLPTPLKNTAKKQFNNRQLPMLPWAVHKLKGRPIIFIMRPTASLTRCYAYPIRRLHGFRF